jgi:hypothetical protein
MKQISIAVLFMCLFGCQSRPPLTTGMEGKKMPAFDITLIDSTKHMNTDMIATGTPVVLFFFSPNCPYCQAQTKDMLKNSAELKKYRFVFLTTAPYLQLKGYYDHFKLANYTNITVGTDNSYFVQNTFKTFKVPFTIIYNSNKTLKQAFLGKTSSKTIEYTIEN